MLALFSKYKITIFFIVFCFSFALCQYLNISVTESAYLIGILLITLLICYIKQLYLFSFVFTAIVVALSINITTSNLVYDYPAKIIKPVPGMFRGEISDVLRQNDKVASLLCKGDAKCKYLPNLHKTTLLMTIFKKDSTTYKAGSEIITPIELRPPRPASLPTDFDEITYAKSLGANYLAFTSGRNVAITDLPNALESLRETVYSHIYSLLSANMHEENSAIAYALITGDKTKIPWQIKREFAVAGTAHILAVSGLHVGIIAMAIYVLLGFIAHQKIKFFSFSVLLFTYIWLTGFRITALRAGIMAVLYLYFQLRQRQVKAINIISSVAMINILLQPMVIYSVGFQMSLLAIGGIVLFYGEINSRLKWLFKIQHEDSGFVLNSLSLSLATSLTLSPLIAYYFNMFSGIGFFANILVVPAAMAALSFSALGLVFSYVFIGTLFMYGADLILALMVFINKINVEMFAFLLFENNPFYLASAFTLIFLILLYIKKGFWKIILSISVSTCIVLIFIYQNKSDNGVNIYPREQLTAVEISSPGKTLYVLSERMPNQYAKRDIALENYIASKSGELYIGITGNSGIKLCDNLKDSITFTQIELDHKSQRIIEKSLDLPQRLPQIINLTK